MRSGRVENSVNGLVDRRDGSCRPSGLVEEGAVEGVGSDLKGDAEIIENVGGRRLNLLARGEEGAVEIMTDTIVVGAPVDGCWRGGRLGVGEDPEDEGIKDRIGISEARCYHRCADEVVIGRLVGRYDDRVALRDIDR